MKVMRLCWLVVAVMAAFNVASSNAQEDSTPSPDTDNADPEDNTINTDSDDPAEASAVPFLSIPGANTTSPDAVNTEPDDNTINTDSDDAEADPWLSFPGATTDNEIYAYAPSAPGKDMVAETFELLRDGELYFQLPEKRDIVLLLGNTGSGKSTFAQFLAGDNNDLESVEKGIGQYIIRDKGGKISNSTIESKTIYPELIFDPQTNTSFVDCPGYIDTRNASYDIAATYLIKRAVDKAAKVKIIFAVSFSSVQSGGDRNDFSNLLKHASNFIKNIDNFNDSIGLVVTKVDKITKKLKEGKKRMEVMVTDTEMKSGIAKFIKEEVRPAILKKISENIDVDSSKQQLKLVDIFLTPNADDYDKFELFRKPDEEGPLSEVEILQDGKPALENLVHNATTYSSKTEADFGYTISAESRNAVTDLVDVINNEISKDVKTVAEGIEAHFRIKESKSPHNVLELYEQLKEEHHFVAPLLQENNNSSETLIESLRQIVEKYDVFVPDGTVERIAKHIKYFDFLQVVSVKELKPRHSDWNEHFNTIVKYLNDARNWYGFLVGLQSKLSEYEIQNDTSKYNVADLNDWGETGKQRGIQITNDNLELFLNKIESLNIRYYDSVKGNSIDEFQLSVLNTVLSVTLRLEPELEHISETLKATGHFIKLSDVAANLTSLLRSRKIVKFVEIFAINTLFIDDDIDLWSTRWLVHFSIIAEKWDVQGSRKLNLDGKKADHGHFSSYMASANQNGKPGLPGGSGSSFVGVGVHFINSNNLKITANGGSGSSGQHGGHGVAGKNGKNPTKPEGWNNYDTYEELAAASEWHCVFRSYSQTSNDLGEHNYRETITTWYFDMYGSAGTDGTRGGDGGLGGAGGVAGNVHQISLKDKSDIELENRAGVQGKGGQGGKGGASAKHGDKHHYLFYTVYKVRWHGGKERKRYLELREENKDNRTRAGLPGVDNSKNAGQPENPAYLLNPTESISDYKTYLRENLVFDYKKKPITEIINYLDNSTEILSLYDTAGLLTELRSLEGHFYRLKSKVDFLPLYESLLRRIQHYAENPRSDESSLDYRKVHNFLYTAVLSKISSLKSAAYGFHVVDIKVYMDLAISNINNWEEMTMEQSITQHNKDYKDDIDRKAEGAKEFIDQQITTEIENINTQVGRQIDQLISEITKQKDEARQNLKDMATRREELKRTLKLQGIFGIVKLVSTVVGVMGPYGAAAGGLIGTSNAITEKFVLESETTTNYGKTVPTAGVKKLLNAAEKNIKEVSDKKIAVLENSLELMLSEIQRYPDELGSNNMAENVENIRTEFRQARSSGTLVLVQVNQLQVNFHNELEKKKKELKAGDKDKKGPALKVLEQLNSASNIVTVSLDIYDKYKEDKNKIAEIGSAIEGEIDAINKLKQYEDAIYTTMLPMISGMKEGINRLERELGGKSQVGLDVAKWQIKTKIKDLQIQMEQFTEGFDTIQADLSRCIEKLSEAMDILITVYDRIQSYQEQKKLADFITAITSPKAKDISDPVLSAAVVNLELTIKSNIILSQYERAVASFKQFVFPFAPSFLLDTNLPSSLQLGNDTKTLVRNAAQGIKALRLKIGLGGAIIDSNRDTKLQNHDFQNNSSIPRFYVWESSSNNVEISQLLSGKEVALTADVSQIKNLNAVKFSLIGLRLKSLNVSLQESLNDVMLSFNVSLTHLGNSHYRCDHRFYVIPSDILTITYSFKLNDKKEPETRNEVYDKLKNGDLTLSPYAMWKIQLKGPDFSVFEQYKNQIDVELVGVGKYLENNHKVCKTDLENYYTLDKTLNDVKLKLE